MLLMLTCGTTALLTIYYLNKKRNQKRESEINKKILNKVDLQCTPDLDDNLTIFQKEYVTFPNSGYYNSDLNNIISFLLKFVLFRNHYQ